MKEQQREESQYFCMSDGTGFQELLSELSIGIGPSASLNQSSPPLSLKVQDRASPNDDVFNQWQQLLNGHDNTGLTPETNHQSGNPNHNLTENTACLTSSQGERVGFDEILGMLNGSQPETSNDPRNALTRDINDPPESTSNSSRDFLPLNLTVDPQGDTESSPLSLSGRKSRRVRSCVTQKSVTSSELGSSTAVTPISGNSVKSPLSQHSQDADNTFDVLFGVVFGPDVETASKSVLSLKSPEILNDGAVDQAKENVPDFCLTANETEMAKENGKSSVTLPSKVSKTAKPSASLENIPVPAGKARRVNNKKHVKKETAHVRKVYSKDELIQIGSESSKCFEPPRFLLLTSEVADELEAGLIVDQNKEPLKVIMQEFVEYPENVNRQRGNMNNLYRV